MRQTVDFAARVGGKHDRAIATGDVDVMMDVAERLIGRQRIQPVVHGDALAQLAQLVARQVGFEFGLPHQEDLQQLVALVLEVRQQPDLLEQVHRQVLRFVHHEHGVLAARTHGDEALLQHDEQRGLAGAGLDLHAEAQADLLQQLLARQG